MRERRRSALPPSQKSTRMNATGVFSRPLALFHRGAYAEAERLLADHHGDPQADRLLLKIALRRRDWPSILACGVRLSASSDLESACAGRCYENVARGQAGLELLPWLAPSTAWSQAELAYARASIAFTRGDVSAILTELSQSPPTTSEQRIKYIQMRAWAEALRGNFERQAVLLLNALTRAQREELDSGGVAQIAHPLAVLLREIEFGEFGDHAERLLHQVTWPEDGTQDRFAAQRALAWRSSLRGEWISALRTLDEALIAAPDAFYRGLIFVDKARVARAAGESMGAGASALLALELLSTLDADTAKSEGVIALYGAMDVLAIYHRSEAGRLFEAFDDVRLSKMAGYAHGDRLSALRSYALAFLNDGQEALTHASSAYKSFKSMRYVHRAAACAVRAVEVRGGVRWRERAERLCALYPRSLIAKEFQRVTSPMSRLRGRRREVVELLVTTGKTAREIGEQLGITEGTVRVHIKRINKLLKTTSRSDLVRLFMKNVDAA